MVHTHSNEKISQKDNWKYVVYSRIMTSEMWAVSVRRSGCSKESFMPCFQQIAKPIFRKKEKTEVVYISRPTEDK